mmetsp:Transcript_32792/g.110492  ORF Transcript_32792/g.110492 Transcript_32792/m.110492 type:complete len:413 (-) Transcript_32792:2479-3717(-)
MRRGVGVPGRQPDAPPTRQRRPRRHRRRRDGRRRFRHRRRRKRLARLCETDRLFNSRRDHRPAVYWTLHLVQDPRAPAQRHRRRALQDARRPGLHRRHPARRPKPDPRDPLFERVPPKLRRRRGIRRGAAPRARGCGRGLARRRRLGGRAAPARGAGFRFEPRRLRPRRLACHPRRRHARALSNRRHRQRHRFSRRIERVDGAEWRATFRRAQRVARRLRVRRRAQRVGTPRRRRRRAARGADGVGRKLCREAFADGAKARGRGAGGGVPSRCFPAPNRRLPTSRHGARLRRRRAARRERDAPPPRRGEIRRRAVPRRRERRRARVWPRRNAQRRPRRRRRPVPRVDLDGADVRPGPRYKSGERRRRGAPANAACASVPRARAAARRRAVERVQGARPGGPLRRRVSDRLGL